MLLHQKKKVRAVRPYEHKKELNFKIPAYNAWRDVGGKVSPSHYPWRIFHRLAFRHELPEMKFWGGLEVRLMFVEPISISFDTFPYYATHEVIPFIWDCWPIYFDKMKRWLKRHKVRTAIFTSKQEMEEMKRRVPGLNTIWCPEAVDTSMYKEGKPLKERSVDLLEFGRSNRLVVNGEWLEDINHVCTKVEDKFLYTNEQLYDAMGDAKITICLPRCMTQPEVAGNIETLTQRYWEAMLSRMVIVGHAPQELIYMVGYNPVIELDSINENYNHNEKRLKGLGARKQICDILEHIEDYQELVDRNRKVALEMGDWKERMKSVRDYLNNNGYHCKQV